MLIWYSNLSKCSVFYLAALPREKRHFLSLGSKWGKRLAWFWVFSSERWTMKWDHSKIEQVLTECIFCTQHSWSYQIFTGKQNRHRPIQVYQQPQEKDKKKLFFNCCEVTSRPNVGLNSQPWYQEEYALLTETARCSKRQKNLNKQVRSATSLLSKIFLPVLSLSFSVTHTPYSKNK